MFEHLLDSSQNRERTRPWALVISLSVQMIAMAGMILITIIQMEALPESMQLTFLAAPAPPRRRLRRPLPARFAVSFAESARCRRDA